jgi:hypothetical protein
MTRALISIMRSAFIAWLFAVTIGVLYAARGFWISAMTHPATHMSLLETTARTVLYTSPMIVMMSSFFALLVIPLAVWSVGSTSWSSLKRYIYVFWLVLAAYIVAFGNADGVILISGVGLIGLWFLANRKNLNPEEVGLNHKPHIHMPLQRIDTRSDFGIFAVLISVVCALTLFLFFGNGTKAYVSEIFAIYAVACACQGLKAFQVNVRGRNLSPK